MFFKEFLLTFILLINIYFCESVGLKNSVEMQNVHVCPENDKLKEPVSNLKFTKINKTHSALTMDYSYAKDIDDKTGYTVKLERWSDGGWVEWPFLPKQKNMCKSMMKLFPSIWLEANKDTNITHPDKCPIPAGRYHMENHIFDFTGLYAPIRLGKFRLTIKVTDDENKDLLYCLILEVTVEQRVNGV
ncbi:uncharacterized protein LOC123321106 [Coccinella septempunctata]|uniref:uncharacterized protein LOC123321106 n=1 Tax=Coccinella septempunctata TaxID=41139 RepID=UPI001D0934A7|nr:uncharacterized protein LOC123321106 [Coccinella septempunctata]